MNTIISPLSASFAAAKLPQTRQLLKAVDTFFAANTNRLKDETENSQVVGKACAVNGLSVVRYFDGSYWLEIQDSQGAGKTTVSISSSAEVEEARYQTEQFEMQVDPKFYAQITKDITNSLRYR